MGESASNSAGVGAASGGDGGDGGQAAQANTSTEGTKSVENLSGDNKETQPKTEEQTKDNRTTFRERIKKHYPDSDHKDNETFYKDANTRYGNLSDYQKKNEAINKNMIDTFNSNPELSGFMRDVMKGAPINEAIARNMDVDSIKPMEGDADHEGWSKALGERKQKLSDREAYTKSIDDNVGLTVTEIQSFQKEEGLSDEDTQTFMKQVDELISDAITGKVSKATLQRLYRAITADNDIAVAEVKGRNANIEAKKVITKSGDGMPNLQSTTEDKGDATAGKVDKWSLAIDEHVKRRSL